MRTHYSDIEEHEKKVLQDQYEASPFYLNNKQDLKPTQLDIFDFDSTLFLSPSLSPTIWHPSLIRQLVGEDVFGPGWWKDYRSLDLGPMDKLEKTQWANYWNEDIVAKARQSLADPTIMTVVLTGRRAIPFYPLISRMVASKKLDFDLLGLRPDPTQESHDAHVKNQATKKTNYGASSVFANTLDFKTCFILNLLHNIPSLKTVNMWDDRKNHVKKFQEFLNRLTDRKQLLGDGSTVQHVKPVLPRYRPLWEQKVVTHVLETHNANELLYQQEQLWDRNINTITWNDEQQQQQEEEEAAVAAVTVAVAAPYLIKVAKHLSLKPIPSATVIKLDPSTVETLRMIFEPYYTTELRKQHQEWSGWRSKAEIPQWFGHSIVLSPRLLTPQQLEQHHGQGLCLGAKMNIVLRKISKPDPDLGMVALVNIYPGSENTAIGSQKRYLLPLIYKPSQATTILKQAFEWAAVPGNQQHFGQGEIGLAHLLGLDGKVKGGEEHQLVCLDYETKQNVLGKRAVYPIGRTDKKRHLQPNDTVE